MEMITVNIVLAIVRNKISQRNVNLNISRKNITKWCTIIAKIKNENLSGVSRAFIFMV